MMLSFAAFKLSIDMLLFYLFQTLCLALFNSLIGITPTFNKKVFHQQELEDAGFDVERLERVIHLYVMHVLGFCKTVLDTCST